MMQGLQNMQTISSVYGKDRNQKVNKEWKEDSTEKHRRASQGAVAVAAAKTFLMNIYENMKTLKGDL